MIRLWSDTWNGYAKRGYRNDEPVSSVTAFHNSMTRNSLMCSMSELGHKRKSSVSLGMSAVGGQAEVDMRATTTQARSVALAGRQRVAVPNADLGFGSEWLAGGSEQAIQAIQIKRRVRAITLYVSVHGLPQNRLAVRDWALNRGVIVGQ